MSLKDAHFVHLGAALGTTMGAPLGDTFKSGVISDTVSMVKYHIAYFCLLLGARTGSTAAPVLTVVPISAVGGTTTTAIPFEYKLVATPDTNSA